ncbi:MAG: acylphosphatase [Acidobacteria bacterium]|nr:acylphosphatase [Acidobacteriota bacterium]
MKTVRRYRVSGRVQGVGYRAFVWREAQALGLDGWVRNNQDGTVELLIAAVAENHELLERRLREGPRWGRVEAVEVVEEPGESLPPGFGMG